MSDATTTRSLPLSKHRHRVSALQIYTRPGSGFAVVRYRCPVHSMPRRTLRYSRNVSLQCCHYFGYSFPTLFPFSTNKIPVHLHQIFDSIVHNPKPYRTRPRKQRSSLFKGVEVQIVTTRVVPRNDRRGVTNQQTPRSIRHGFYSSIDGCNAL